MIYHFDTLGSTNDEAQKDCYSHGDVIVAEQQTAGRGQRGNRWLSCEGQNLTLSVVWLPEMVAVRDQFIVSQAVALAICDMLRSNALEPRIKWTNDIYIGERKIVGILIENKLSGTHLSRSVIGIGLNVNQREFDPLLPNPTSMAQQTGNLFDRERVLEQLSAALTSRFESLKALEYNELRQEYHSLMYRRGELHPFRLPSGEQRDGVIEGVANSGELIIDWQCGERASYLFGEVEFVIASRKR